MIPRMPFKLIMSDKNLYYLNQIIMNEILKSLSTVNIKPSAHTYVLYALVLSSKLGIGTFN